MKMQLWKNPIVPHNVLVSMNKVSWNLTDRAKPPSQLVVEKVKHL